MSGRRVDDAPVAERLVKLEMGLFQVGEDVGEIKRNVRELIKVLHVGNGAPPLVQRVAALENGSTAKAKVAVALIAAMGAVLGGVVTALIGAG